MKHTHHSPQASSRWKPMAFLAFLCLSTLGGCLTNCQPLFSPRSVIDKYRLLAIRAEPPEIGPGDTTRISMLTVTPDGTVKSSEYKPFPSCITDAGVADPSAFWIACLPGTGAVQTSDQACTQFPGVNTDGGDGGGVPTLPTPGQDAGDSPFSLVLPPCGSNATWTAPKDYLSKLPKADQFKGREVLLVSLLTFKGKQQTSLKRIKLSTKPKEQRNRNPVALSFQLKDKDVSTCTRGKPFGCDVLESPANVPIELKIRVDLKSRDTLPPNEQKELKQEEEDFRISWYATNGELDNSSTYLVGGKNPPAPQWPKWYPNTFEGKKLKEGDTIQLYALVSDYRGGIDWISIRIKLTAPVANPPSSD